jgi:superfamily II DNA or RNA helicase
MSTVLRFDRGTLLLEGGEPPIALRGSFVHDSRVDAWRAPAISYPKVIPFLRGMLGKNTAPRYRKLMLEPRLTLDLYPHQKEALERWKAARGRGLVVLPTGAGKTLVGMLSVAWAARSTLVVVPTLDLMHQWYALLRAAFPEVEVGLIGGGYHEPLDLVVVTYDSAARHMDRLGDRYGLLIFDEVHHLPSEFYRAIAEFSLAPYRLGLTATPERTDGRHEGLFHLVGPLVYRREAVELAGKVLAPYRVERVYVDLSRQEREAYEQALEERNHFLQSHNVSLSSLEGWSLFVKLSARSEQGRRAMRTHREARRIAHATASKLRALEAILAAHPREKTVIFTEDNATAYEVSTRLLIPCLTHKTPVKERQEVLERFKAGLYIAIVASKVLNEGVDVPEASVGVVLSGSSVAREFVQRLGRLLRKSEGKRAVLYEVVARATREERVADRRRQGVGVDSLQLDLLLDAPTRGEGRGEG